MGQVVHLTDESIFTTRFTIIENFGVSFPAFHIYNVAVSIFLHSFVCVCMYACLCLFSTEQIPTGNY